MSFHVDGFNTWRVYIALSKGSLHKTKILQNTTKWRLGERLKNGEHLYQCTCDRENDDANPFVTLQAKLERQGYTVIEGREIGNAPLGFKFLAYIRESRDWGVLTVWQKG